MKGIKDKVKQRLRREAIEQYTVKAVRSLLALSFVFVFAFVISFAAMKTYNIVSDVFCAKAEKEQDQPKPLVVDTDKEQYAVVTVYKETGEEQYFGLIKQSRDSDNLSTIEVYTNKLPDQMSNDGWCEE